MTRDTLLGGDTLNTCLCPGGVGERDFSALSLSVDASEDGLCSWPSTVRADRVLGDGLTLFLLSAASSECELYVGVDFGVFILGASLAADCVSWAFVTDGFPLAVASFLAVIFVSEGPVTVPTFFVAASPPPALSLPALISEQLPFTLFLLTSSVRGDDFVSCLLAYDCTMFEEPAPLEDWLEASLFVPEDEVMAAVLDFLAADLTLSCATNELTKASSLPSRSTARSSTGSSPSMLKSDAADAAD